MKLTGSARGKEKFKLMQKCSRRSIGFYSCIFAKAKPPIWVAAGPASAEYASERNAFHACVVEVIISPNSETWNSALCGWIFVLIRVRRHMSLEVTLKERNGLGKKPPLHSTVESVGARDVKYEQGDARPAKFQCWPGCTAMRHLD